MIGGCDVIIRTPLPSAVVEEVLKHIQIVWRDLIVEDAETGRIIPLGLAMDIPQEFFVYQTSKAKAIWDEKGACSENKNSMLHLLVGLEELTLVLDDLADRSINQIVEVAMSVAREIANLRQEVNA
jgi:hypothetical protein